MGWFRRKARLFFVSVYPLTYIYRFGFVTKRFSGSPLQCLSERAIWPRAPFALSIRRPGLLVLGARNRSLVTIRLLLSERGIKTVF